MAGRPLLRVSDLSIGVGGIGTISGAVFGALFIQFVPNLVEQVSKAAPWAVYGIFLLGCMYLMPDGVVGQIRLLGGELAGRLDRAEGMPRRMRLGLNHDCLKKPLAEGTPNRRTAT